jgi:hypothetical protein
VRQVGGGDLEGQPGWHADCIARTRVGYNGIAAAR